MGDRSKIEWTDATWNPVTGCSKVSPGCAHCYAEKFAERWRGIKGHPFEQGFDLRLWPDRLDWPLRWRRPRRIFVNSMSDLFHDAVPFHFIDAVMETCERAHWHNFLILTKRVTRAAHYFRRLMNLQVSAAIPYHLNIHWPLSNVWIGASVEDQKRAQERIPTLLEINAPVRFLSCEPLLGPVVFRRPDFSNTGLGGGWLGDTGSAAPQPAGIHWVIVGGESGFGARPMELKWARGIVGQCLEAETPVFVKQLGTNWAATNRAMHSKGGDPAEWPEDLRIREFPEESEATE